MSLFRYRALDENNCIVENTIKAVSIQDANNIITEKGLTPINISETGGLDSFEIELFQNIKINDVVTFCRELSIIIKSGINLSVGLGILRKQSSNKLKESIYDIEVEIQKGRTLAQAMKECKYKFPDLLIKMILVGQSSGNLDAVLDNMAEYYERENFIKQRVRSATFYPAILVTFGIVLLWFFSYFVLPSLQELMVGQELPLITKIVLGIAGFIASLKFLYLIIFLVLAIVIFIKVVPSAKLRKYRDTVIVRIPFIGSVIKDIVTVRFISTLHLLNKSGVNIVSILELISDVISNSKVEESIQIALEGIKRGETLGKMLSASDYFDPLVLQMISIGEETGELDTILEEISGFYQKKLEIKINKMVALIEPVFTLVIGGFIGIVIVAIAMPLFNMTGMIDTGGVGIE